MESLKFCIVTGQIAVPAVAQEAFAAGLNDSSKGTNRRPPAAGGDRRVACGVEPQADGLDHEAHHPIPSGDERYKGSAVLKKVDDFSVFGFTT